MKKRRRHESKSKELEDAYAAILHIYQLITSHATPTDKISQIKLYIINFFGGTDDEPNEKGDNSA